MIFKPPLSNPSTKGLWQMFSSTIWLGLWVFAIGLLVSILLLRWWPGDRLLAVRMINYSMPWFLALLLPALVLCRVMGHKGLALALALPAIYILITYLPLFLPNRQPPETTTPPLKVMSYNVWSRNPDTAAIAKIILAEKPDLLLMQEITPARVRELKTLLGREFPETEEHFVYNPKGLLATFSRYPLTAFPAMDRRVLQKVRVDTPEGMVTVYNVHFLRTVLRRRNNWQQLHNQVAGLLVDEIAATEGAVIMGGDFNLTDQTETYRLICRQLQNAHWEAGWGFGFTYPSPNRKLRLGLTLPAMVRIDHLFYSSSLAPVNAGTLPDAGGSDHLPIFAELTRLKQ